MQTPTPENEKGRRAGNTTTPMQTRGDATAADQRQQPPDGGHKTACRVLALQARGLVQKEAA